MTSDDANAPVDPHWEAVGRLSQGIVDAIAGVSSAQDGDEASGTFVIDTEIILDAVGQVIGGLFEYNPRVEGEDEFAACADIVRDKVLQGIRASRQYYRNTGKHPMELMAGATAAIPAEG